MRRTPLTTPPRTTLYCVVLALVLVLGWLYVFVEYFDHACTHSVLQRVLTAVVGRICRVFVERSKRPGRE